jgi:hypothetical protein
MGAASSLDVAGRAGGTYGNALVEEIVDEFDLM